MNNYKMNYAKKYHYMLKYFVMAFPLLVFLFACINASSSSTYLSDISTYVYTCVNNLMTNTPALNWYTNILISMGLQYSTNYLIILEVYPLYILGVLVFDILIDILGIFPRLIHKVVGKIGGDY